MARVGFSVVLAAVALISIVDLKSSGVEATRVTIQSPDDFERFKNRTYLATNDLVTVEQSACADLMAQPKNFSNAQNDEITFHETEFRSNKVVLRPKAREVTAHFSMGHNLTLGLPADLRVYHLNFWYVSSVTRADLDYIVTWKNAIHLSVDDQAGVAVGLVQRIKAMSAMRNLSFLKLQIAEHSLAQMELGPFFAQIPSLKRVEFTFDRLIADPQVREFLRGQVIPQEFVRIDSGHYFHAFFEKKN